MKKILFAALLVAGTTLGFAKDNVLESKKDAGSKIKEEKKESEAEIKKICTTIYTWTTTYQVTGLDGVTQTVTDLHTAQTSSWCGANAPRTTFVNGEPN